MCSSIWTVNLLGLVVTKVSGGMKIKSGNRHTSIQTLNQLWSVVTSFYDLKKKRGGGGGGEDCLHRNFFTWLKLQSPCGWCYRSTGFFCPIGSIEQPVTVKCIRFLTLSARQQLERMPRRQPEANKAPAGNANPTITNPESGLASSQTSSSSESQFLLAKWVRWFSSPRQGLLFQSNCRYGRN